MASKVSGLLSRLPSLQRVAYGFGEASNALTLLLFVLLARGLGVDRYGAFVAIVAASAILQAVAELGLHTLLTRTVARAPDAAWHELRGALIRQAALIFPAPLLIYGYMRIADIPADAHLAGVLIGASVWFRALKESVRGVCRGLGRFGLEALFNWTERVGLLAAGVAVIALGGSLTAVGIVFFSVRAVDFAVFVGTVRRRLRRPLLDPRPREATLLAALPFAVSNLMWSMYYQVDTALLSALSTPRDTGIYGALYRFVDLVQVLPRLLIVVAFPVMVVDWSHNRDRFHRLFRSLRSVITCAALPVLFVLAGWSAPIIGLAFGPEYVEGARALSWIMLGNYFAFHSLLLVQASQAAGRERALAVGLTLTVALNVVLNVLLIPRLGFRGAAFATALTEVTYAGILGWIAWRAGVTPGLPFGPLEAAGALVLAGVALGADWLTTPAAAALLILAWLVVLARLKPYRVLLRRPV
jgi:O-antigen/teichoic acid export membrane protein